MNLTSGIILAGILTLSGCSSIKQLDIFSLDFEREPLALEKPTIQELEKLKWIIITSENANEVFKKMKEQGKTNHNNIRMTLSRQRRSCLDKKDNIINRTGFQHQKLY